MNLATLRLDPDRRLAALALTALSAILLTAFLVKPGTTAWLPQCPIYEFTGLYCPGCGTTRMLYLLVHGHPWLAFRENAFSMLAFVIVVAELIRKLAGKKSIVSTPSVPRLATAFAVILIVFTVARNIPRQPFNKLAPQQLSQLALR